MLEKTGVPGEIHHDLPQITVGFMMYTFGYRKESNFRSS